MYITLFVVLLVMLVLQTWHRFDTNARDVGVTNLAIIIPDCDTDLMQMHVMLVLQT